MKKNMALLLAECALSAYNNPVDYGKGLEAKVTVKIINDEMVTILAFTGTNDDFSIFPWKLWDWVRNLDIRTYKGLKRSSLKSAERMNRLIVNRPRMPLYVTGHSLGASRAIAYADRFPVAGGAFFNPPPTVAKKRKKYLRNCLLCRDPDDLVDTAGSSWFDHPICQTITRKDNYSGHKLSEHSMALWVPYLERCK